MLSALLLLALVQDSPTAATPTNPNWSRMDYGPFLTTAMTLPNGTVTPKGVAVKLGSGAACFDTDLLRYAAAWDGGWLELLGPPFEGSRSPDEKTRPKIKGTAQFVTHNIPGFIRAGKRDDPRTEPYGPLPADWAKYKGLYISGDRVVFSYTAGDCEILDLPGFEHGAFTRTLKFGPAKEAVEFLVAECPEPAESDFADGVLRLGTLDACCVGLTGSSFWRQVGKTRLYLSVAPHGGPIVLKVAVGTSLKAVSSVYADGHLEDPSTLTQGGPPRYAAPVVTRGTLGKTGAAYEVDTLTAPDENPWNAWMRLSGLDFFSDGRAAVCTWSGDVWVVSGLDASLEKLSWKRWATGLFQPCGLRIVDDTVYVVARDQITVFRDLNGDGEPDYYENFNNDCHEKGNYHEFAMDLNTDPEGNFYYCKGGLGANFPGGPVASHHGCLLKVSKDGKKLEIVATGIRAAAGSGVGPHGELTTSDNDGHWGPASRINWVKPGGYYGDPYTAHRKPTPEGYDVPLCWIHRSVDNSSGGEVWVSSDRWGPFQGAMLHLSYGTCSLFNVVHEEVDGVMQGGVVRFPMTFASGVLRGRFHPKDGQLYVAGLKGWSTSGTREGCLQRVRYTDKPAHMISGMHVRKDAIELQFTDPVDPVAAADPDSWVAQQWNYRYTGSYGSADYSVASPKKQGRDDVEIASIAVSKDGKTVTLSIPGLQPVMQMLLRCRMKAADGAPINQDVWHTINKIPQ